MQTDILADLDRRLGPIDAAIEKTADRGRGKAAMALADQQHKNRADLLANRQQEAKTLADLRVQRARVDGKRKAVEADLGPVRYLATLLGSTGTPPCATSFLWWPWCSTLRPSCSSSRQRVGGRHER